MLPAEEVDLPAIDAEIVTKDVERAVVAAHAKVAVAVAVPTIQYLGDAAHAPRRTEAHRQLSAPGFRMTLHNEMGHACAPVVRRGDRITR